MTIKSGIRVVSIIFCVNIIIITHSHSSQGFQGLLHMEIFRQRLLNEFELDVIVTPPKVPYIIELQSKNDPHPQIKIIDELSQWPSSSTTQQQQKITIKEPVVSIRIMSPSTYAGNILELVKSRRGFNMVTTPTVDDQSWIVDADMPWVSFIFMDLCY